MSIRTNKLFFLIGVLISLAFPAHASIISVDTVDTTFGNGKSANLQGLKWLSLDETTGVSRSDIENNYNDLMSDGWRYATYDEAALLISSLWDGVYSASVDNYAGLRWFEDNFGLTSYNFSNPAHPAEDRSAGAYIFFGEYGVCENSSFDKYSCLMLLRVTENVKDWRGYNDGYVPQSTHNVQTDEYVRNIPVGANVGEIFRVGAITGPESNRDFVGGWDSNSTYNNPSSLLVWQDPSSNQDFTEVSEPLGLLLFGLSLLGFVTTRRKTHK